MYNLITRQDTVKGDGGVLWSVSTKHHRAGMCFFFLMQHILSTTLQIKCFTLIEENMLQHEHQLSSENKLYCSSLSKLKPITISHGRRQITCISAASAVFDVYKKRHIMNNL